MPMKKSSKQAWDRQHRPAANARQRKYRAKQATTKRSRPFVGVDGEGGGTSEHTGQQNYLLLRAGDHVLFHDNRPLSTKDCLEFLSSLPTGCIYVSFFFDYDASQITRDIPPHKLKDLLVTRRQTVTRVGGKSDTILFDDYEIGWFPRKHFKVRKIGAKHFVTIHDVGTFFQCAFTSALKQWEILEPDALARMVKMKAKRSSFDLMTPEEMAYNLEECEALAALMTKYRGMCEDIGYLPRKWEGPGQLAAAMLDKHSVTKRNDQKLPPELLRFANEAYYGGRFEVFRIGWTPAVIEYDIASAYPTAYRTLPCLAHGSWRHGEGKPPEGVLAVAEVRYSHKGETPIVCNLPHRVKSGSLVWQREGNGLYWSDELRAAQEAGTVIREWREHWWYERQCDCQPFAGWVEEVYQKRLALGKSLKGVPLKLALNSVYGKTAQSIGVPPYANPVWAGLITSYCRTRLIDAYKTIDPENLIMLATDGLYTTEPLSGVSIGKQLGQWEEKEPRELFIVKPGFYFDRDGSYSAKTRGVSKEDFARFREKLVTHFYITFDTSLAKGIWPTVPMTRKIFISTRWGLHLNAPARIGRWEEQILKHSFDPRVKRAIAGRARQPRSSREKAPWIATKAHMGSPHDRSIPYNRIIGGGMVSELSSDGKQTLRKLEVFADMFGAAPTDQQYSAMLQSLQCEGYSDEELFDNDDEGDENDLIDL